MLLLAPQYYLLVQFAPKVALRRNGSPRQLKIKGLRKSQRLGMRVVMGLAVVSVPSVEDVAIIPQRVPGKNSTDTSSDVQQSSEM
jgi:hypothetical protein